MREWLCSCGAWVPFAWGRHVHVSQEPASLEALLNMRAAAAAGLHGIVPDALAAETEITNEWRTPQHQTRDAP